MDASVAKKISRIAKSVVADDDDSHDIDIRCFYDTISAQEQFAESFKVLAEDVYGYEWNDVDVNDVFEIDDYDALAEYYDYDDRYYYQTYVDAMPPDDVAKCVMKAYSAKEISEICLAEIKNANDLSEWIVDNHDDYCDDDDSFAYEWVFDLLPDERAYDNAVEYAKSQISLPPEDEIYKMFDRECGIGMKDGYDYVTIHGYSKGESCVVLYKVEDVTDTDIFQNMIYSCPVCCRIKVDGEDYYVDDEMKDSYDYDKKEVIEIMRRLVGDKYDDEIEEYLEENLPQYPSYN